jgi:hypothetical protein
VHLAVHCKTRGQYRQQQAFAVALHQLIAGIDILVQTDIDQVHRCQRIGVVLLQRHQITVSGLGNTGLVRDARVPAKTRAVAGAQVGTRNACAVKPLQRRQVEEPREAADDDCHAQGQQQHRTQHL